MIMKSLRFKSVILLASLLIISGMSAEGVLAQGRGGRGGGGGGGSHSSGGGGSRGGGGSSSHANVGGGSPRGGGASAGISRGGNRGNYSSGGGNRGNYSSGGGTAYRGRGNAIFRGGNRGGVYAGGRSRGFYGGGRFAGRPGFYRHGFGRPYYGYYNYYRPYLGFSLNILPFGYYPFYYGDVQYYYSQGLYYRQYDNQYKVVVPPVGAEVSQLPSDAQEVTINGQTYYEYKGVYYSPLEKTDGKTAYIIAGKDGVLNTDSGDINAGSGMKIGDIVTELPEGTRQVTLKGQKLYVSEDGVYYEEVQDGDKLTYRVVGI